MAGRPKKARGMTTTTTKLKRKPRTKTDKPLVRINKSSGKNFENFIFKYMTDYLAERDIVGLVYKLPDGLRGWEQPIDLLVDSADFGYLGIEAKSIADGKLDKQKVYLKKLSRKNAKYGDQFTKEHIFLRDSCRFGLVAFEFIDRGVIVFVPHQYIYDGLKEGIVYYTVDEIIQHGFDISDTQASLKLFIKRNCQTI